jgi:predicted  nucleic acid-binding Zn-ribbon protein
VEKLIDSLNLDRKVKSGLDKQALVSLTRNNIATSMPASDTFEITYYDSDPVRAHDGAALLTDHFIQTRLHLEKKRNNETVEFFEAKIDELEEIVDSQRDKILSSTTKRLKEIPVDQTALQTRLHDIDRQLDQLEWKIIQEQSKLDNLNGFLSQDPQDFTVQPLYKLPLDEMPFGTKLSDLLGEYDQLRQQFTDNYPEVRSLRVQILEVSKRIPPAIESKLSNLKLQQKDLKSQRSSVINDMENSFIAAQRNKNQQSNFSIYQELYNDMKMKLEQARMSQDIGEKASEQFKILSPPYIPAKPTSPNKRFIIGMGVLLGFILGNVFMGITEIFDTTIRSEEDLELEKPIIAYLTDG